MYVNCKYVVCTTCENVAVKVETWIVDNILHKRGIVSNLPLFSNNSISEENCKHVLIQGDLCSNYCQTKMGSKSQFQRQSK